MANASSSAPSIHRLGCRGAFRHLQAALHPASFPSHASSLPKLAFKGVFPSFGIYPSVPDAFFVRLGPFLFRSLPLHRSSFPSPPRPPFVAPKAGAWRRIRRCRLRRRSTRVGNTTCRCLTLRLTPREASHRIQTKLAIRPLGGWTCLFAIGGRRDTGTWPWAMAEGRGTGAAFVGGADEWSTDARLVRRRERSERIGGRIEDAVPCA